MITVELKELVKQEADKLKEFAIKEELNRLDFKTLTPERIDLCIYGQMTGDCFSDRSFDLVRKCSTPFSATRSFYSPSEARNVYYAPPGRRPFSPIEFYISQRGAKNENLINYLKGLTTVLEL